MPGHPDAFDKSRESRMENDEIGPPDEFEIDLRQLKNELSNMETATWMYRALCNHAWINIKTGKKHRMSWRYAGGVVSRLRSTDGIGDYRDFYCSGAESAVIPEIEEMMKKIGYVLEWTEKDQRDMEEVFKFIKSIHDKASDEK